MDASSTLVQHHTISFCVSHSRLLLEIVRPPPTYLSLRSWFLTPLFSYRRTYRPMPYHISQELQEENIPDYRPRQEQYVTSSACEHDVQLDWLMFHVPGSRKQSKKFVQFNACVEIVGSRLVRPRIPDGRTRPGSSEHTTHHRRTHGPPDYRLTMQCMSPVYFVLLVWTSVW